MHLNITSTDYSNDYANEVGKIFLDMTVPSFNNLCFYVYVFASSTQFEQLVNKAILKIPDDKQVKKLTTCIKLHNVLLKFFHTKSENTLKHEIKLNILDHVLMDRTILLMWHLKNTKCIYKYFILPVIFLYDTK